MRKIVALDAKPSINKSAIKLLEGIVNELSAHFKGILDVTIQCVRIQGIGDATAYTIYESLMLRRNYEPAAHIYRPLLMIALDENGNICDSQFQNQHAEEIIDSMIIRDYDL